MNYLKLLQKISGDYEEKQVWRVTTSTRNEDITGICISFTDGTYIDITPKNESFLEVDFKTNPK